MPRLASVQGKWANVLGFACTLHIVKVMKKGEWDLSIAQRLLNWYRSSNSLGRDELAVLAADLQFPHLFCGVASKYFNDRAEDWTDVKLLAKLDQVCRLERQKARLVAQLTRS